jgi:hypothetical protein
MNRRAATTGTTPNGTNDRFALMRMAAVAAAMAGGFALVIMAAVGSTAAAGLAAMVSLAVAAIGYGLGRKDGGMPAAVRLRMFRVADDLAQYRAFTRLLRDQGARITESTGEAASVIVTGLTEIDANLDRMRALVDRAAADDGEELRTLLEAAGAPIVDMMGQLQFQDVTQQQIAFLSRLSLIVDQHMIDLARQLGDRRSMDRITNFKDMFNRALDDCVMSSQREDHHAAVGLDLREASGPKIEIF